MALDSKRWLVLLVGLVANVCQGMAYTSSVFMLPLGKALGAPEGEWSRQWGFIFSMSLAFLPVGMMLAGRLADMGKTKLTVGLGAVLFGSGLFLAGFGQSVLWIAVTFGVMTSLGSGSAYGTVVGTVVRWFPDRRGLASGLAVGAVGVGPIVLAPLAQRLMDAYGVLNMFKILGVASFVAMGLAALYVSNPPAGYAPAGWKPPAAPLGGRASAAGAVSLKWREMLATSAFWLLYVAYICGAFAGILVNSLAAPIGMELAGFTRDQATGAVMAFALANAGGRILWGFLSDKIGRLAMLGAAFVITCLTMFLLRWNVSVPGFYLPCLVLAGLCYGGVLGTFPSLCADFFGVKNAALNYAVLFSSFGIVAVLAPQVVGFYRKAGGAEYPKAFLVAGCVAVIGLALSIIIGRMRSRRTDNVG